MMNNKLIMLIVVLAYPMACHGLYIEQQLLDPLSHSKFSLLLTQYTIDLMHADLYNRLATFKNILRIQKECLDSDYWKQIIPIPKVGTKEQKLYVAAYSATEEAVHKARNNSWNPCHFLLRRWKQPHPRNDSDETRLLTYNKLCRWYSTKTLLLENFRQQFTNIMCDCNEEQKKINHSEIIVYVFNMDIDSMSFTSSNMIQSIGMPEAEKAIWRIPLCLVMQREGLFMIMTKTNNHIYWWPVYPFTASNNELQLIGNIDNTKNPLVQQVDEKNNISPITRLLLVNHYKNKKQD